MGLWPSYQTIIEVTPYLGQRPCRLWDLMISLGKKFRNGMILNINLLVKSPFLCFRKALNNISVAYNSLLYYTFQVCLFPWLFTYYYIMMGILLKNPGLWNGHIFPNFISWDMHLIKVHWIIYIYIYILYTYLMGIYG